MLITSWREFEFLEEVDYSMIKEIDLTLNKNDEQIYFPISQNHLDKMISLETIKCYPPVHGYLKTLSSYSDHNNIPTLLGKIKIQEMMFQIKNENINSNLENFNDFKNKLEYLSYIGFPRNHTYFLIKNAIENNEEWKEYFMSIIAYNDETAYILCRIARKLLPVEVRQEIVEMFINKTSYNDIKVVNILMGDDLHIMADSSYVSLVKLWIRENNNHETFEIPFHRFLYNLDDSWYEYMRKDSKTKDMVIKYYKEGGTQKISKISKSTRKEITREFWNDGVRFKIYCQGNKHILKVQSIFDPCCII